MAFLRRFLARLLSDHKGNVLAIVGAGLVPLAIMIGSGLFSIGLLLWCTGYIANAISFLPARED